MLEYIDDDDYCSQPYFDGKKAFELGVSQFDNPYDDGEYHDSWNHGYETAKAEFYW